MSFSSEIKNKLCTIALPCSPCCSAELSGIFRFSAGIDPSQIKIITENQQVAGRIEDDIREVFGWEMRPEHRPQSRSFQFLIQDTNRVENILAQLMLGQEDIGSLMPFTCCRASYVRGAFLGGGSVNDPQKSYHLEFDTKYQQEAQLLQKVLQEEGIGAKVTYRKGHYIVYLKESDTIAGILGWIGAGQGALELYTVQVEKDMRNTVNRQVNCETANVEKVAKAASRHVRAIEKIKREKGLSYLPDTLREIAELRLAYPEDSLKELGERLQPAIGKSGVNHRLARILEIAREL